MSKIWIRTAATGLLLLAAALGFPQTVQYEKYTLPNGMKVILHEDHSVPMVAVNLWFHVGSKDEAPGRTGFAHLFEHLMFMGTERAPMGQFDVLMEEGGGANNASTSNDRTNYYETGPSNLLPLLLWLEADRLEDLGRTMDKRKLDLQRDVVRNERRESENEPYGKADLKLTELLYPQGHPYFHPVIGSHKDLEAATVQDVKGFFENYYVPNNASLVVAGDFSTVTIKPMIASLFGTLPRGPEPKHLQAPQPKLDKVVRHQMTDQVQAPRVTIAWHSPAAYKPGDAEMSLAAAVLSRGISSRLYQRLIYGKEPLATQVDAYQESLTLGSIFAVEAIARPGVEPEKVQKAIDEVVAEFVSKGPTKRELDRNVAGLEFAILNSLQSLRSKADNLNEFEFYLGEPDSFRRLLETYRRATPASVKRVAAQVLKPEARVILTVTPGDADAEAQTQTDAEEEAITEGSSPERRETWYDNPRDKRPEVGPPKAWNPPTPLQLELANGIKLFYWHRPELPLMSLSLVSSSGADEDPADLSGLSGLTAEMLDEGAGKKGATEFEQALDLLGASFSANASQDSTIASLASTTASFVKALDLYADALLRPRFEQKEWDRVKRLQIEGLKQALDDPATVSRRIAMREYFGTAHAYGRPISGTLASVEKLTLDAIKSRYTSIIAPGRSTMFAAGSLPPDQLKKLLDARFGKWRGVSMDGEKAYPSPQNQKLRVVIAEKPGAPQTVIRFLMPAPTALDPRRIPLVALGTVLGGTFTSRLNTNLREDKGYTYGAGSRYAMDPRVGYLQASAAVRTDVTGASLKEFLAEFEKIRSGDVTAQEVQKARNTVRTDTMESASSLGGMLSLAVEMHRMGKPFSALGDDLKLLEGLTPEQLNALAKEAVAMESALLVLVGDKEQILKQLEGLGLPEPEIVKAD